MSLVFGYAMVGVFILGIIGRCVSNKKQWNREGSCNTRLVRLFRQISYRIDTSMGIIILQKERFNPPCEEHPQTPNMLIQAFSSGHVHASVFVRSSSDSRCLPFLCKVPGTRFRRYNTHRFYRAEGLVFSCWRFCQEGWLREEYFHGVN